MRKCVRCGAELKPAAKFCPNCGMRVSAPEDGGPVCSNCGKQQKPGTRFCIVCGTKLNEGGGSAAAFAAPGGAAGVPGIGGTTVLDGFEETSERSADAGMSDRGPVDRTAESGPIRSGSGSSTTGKAAGGKGFKELTGGEAEPGANPVQTGQTSLYGGHRPGLICPSCGKAVPTGSSVCPYCKTVLRRKNTLKPSGEEPKIRETKSRGGLWAALAATGLLVIGAVAAVLIFWEDIFPPTRDVKATADVDYGIVGSGPTEERLSRDERETTKPADTEADVHWTSGAREDEPQTAEATSQPPATVRTYSWEEIRTIIALRYTGDIEKVGEDSRFFYAEIRDHNTGSVRYALRVDRQSGEIAVAAEYSVPSETTRPSESERDPWTADDEVPESEQTNIGGVKRETVESYMAERVRNTEYSYTVVDLKTGYYTGSENQEEPMSSSVLIGIPVMYAVNRMVEDGDLRLNDTVTIQNLGGGGRGMMTASRMTVLELLQYMLNASSGAAINNLAKYIGMDRINQICHDAGYDSVSYVNYIASPSITDYTASDNYVSTFDLCGMMYELYSGDGPIDRDFLADNFGITIGTDQNNGLGKRVNGVIGSFNGLKGSKYNDLILVEKDGKAYAIAMMAHGDAYTSIMKAMDGIGEYIDGRLME